MKILFDQGTPAPLRHELAGHEVSTAFEMGWATLTNGELLRAAAAQFDLLLTTDQNLPHQQNITHIELGIVILPTTSWGMIRRHADLIRVAIGNASAGQIIQLVFPGMKE